MKHFFALLMIVLFANSTQAQNNYNDLWKKVEQFQVDGLPKSALEIVEQIEAKSNQDKNKSQYIKALLFKSKYTLILEEDAQLSIISNLKKISTESEFPTKNIVENILAKLYWQYFQQNRWQFYNRTNTTEKVDDTDFRTWDLQTLFEEIHLHYKTSLENGLMLQQEDLSQFDAILMLQKGSEIYRPTLFDFLAHNALEFYKTDENSITKPAYKFEVDDPSYLSDATTFSKIKIHSKDTASLQLNALKIYQDLVQFHLKDSEPYALADVDIQRLLYIKQHATFNDKETLLLHALKTESDRLTTHEVSGLYDYQIATVYNQQGRTYQPITNETHRWKLKEALELCHATMSQFPKSRAVEKCAILKQQIENETLQLTAESYIPIESNSRILVRYTNLNQLNFKVYNLSNNQLKRLNKKYRKEEQLSFIKKLDIAKQWTSNLKNEKDYQSHSTEVLLPKLSNGHYVIFASPEENEELTFAYTTVQVTNLGVVEKNDEKQNIFQVIDRRNGLPIVNTNVTLSYKFNNSNTKKTEQLITNTKGEISLTHASDRYRELSIELNYKDDKAYFNNYYISNYYRRYNEDKLTYNSFLFTDRSIYRPGQTVYFKGIAMKTENKKSIVVPNAELYAILYNVNGEEVSRQELTTNAYGSVSSEFVLPNGGLTGQYRINLLGKKTTFDNNSNTYFSVEEYKRPKFETTFDPVTETFKVNDSVTIKGNALAYAGSTITDAKVVYRVHRKVQYPRWYYWYRPWFSSEPQEITHGEAITNNKGEFEITFKALPDESVDKTNLPIFNYEITADVTDINGETRSATTIVNVGYHALTASIVVDGRFDKTKKDQTLSIDTKNLNGEFVPAKGTIKIYKLQAPGDVLRQRPWKAPDYQEFSKAEFKQLFPHDAYTDEDNINNWKKGKLVLEKVFDTKKTKELKLGKIKNWESGQYIILLESKDKFGQFVKDEVKTILYSKTDKTLADKQLFSITTDKTDYKSGDKVVLKLASAGRITVTIDVEKDQNITDTYVVALDNNSKTLSIPVNKDDVGGFAVHYSFSAYNDYKSGNVLIKVPYPKTDLEIETLTFRDKLQPGTDETWSFKIKGPKGDKVAAELLASMYDASLDQFKTHDWSFNPLQKPTYYSSFNRNARHTFGTTNFRVYKPNVPNLAYTHQGYDQLNWYGLHFGNYIHHRRQYLRNLYANTPSSYTSEKKSSIESGTIEGNIVDLTGPLPGVNIAVKGTSEGTQTDFDGNFKLSVTKDATIVISYVGFQTLEIKIDTDNYYKVNLSENASALDEVVVTAQGIRRDKKALGYAVSEVRTEEMEVAEASMADSFSEETLLVYKNKTELSGGTITAELTKKETEKKETDFSGVTIRKNLQETAFFFPQLQTDKDGNVSFNFTTPEALTKWKVQLVVHTKDLESTLTSLETVTQKELMVIPNAPRFLREGDQIKISTKIANLTDKELSGVAVLQLFDALTGTSIDSELSNANNDLGFNVDANGNTSLSWNLDIPDTVQAVQYKVLAKADDFSDGEQNVLPVLSNRMLVTESMPMWIRSNQTKTFTLDKLKNTTSTSLKHHKLTLEMTSNPAWYAVQALPYLMEYPYECNEQTFSRYYANALARHIANSNPRIQEVFNQWKNTDALLSNLEKNQELKSLLIQETPWLRDAQSETEQKKRIALLFDLNKMNNELASAMRKLENGQMSSGGWSWFNGGRENRWITQHIMTGFGHLKQLSVSSSVVETSVIEKAIRYLDKEFVKEYKDIRKYNKDVDLNQDHLSYTQLHYLYMRSFFSDISKSKQVEEITTYYHTQIQKYWLSRPLYAKGLMALITHRMNDAKTANKILKSLKENSITSEELGMYWKENTSSWYWYQAPIETQALMVEVFSEAGSLIQSETKNIETIDNLKIWLLKNKQTNRWKTTKATTEAVYALLLQGSDWLSVTDMVDVVLGSQEISPSKLEDVKVEAGTGYYKTSWSAAEIKPEMANVEITKKGDGIAWGSLYWQYFEDLDKITSAETPLKLKKKLFLKTNSDTGEQISEITENTTLNVGDLVRVRIELRSDRTMEFVHMKDMRAAGLEPVNVLSQYKWQDGLGYYESTKDAATNFFFDYLPKGVYVFEYDLRVNNTGNMSNGITTIQSMYAPEFSSHSEGVRIKVK